MTNFLQEDQARMVRKFFQLLRLAIGSSSEVPQVAKDEWPAIYALALKQTLLGIAPMDEQRGRLLLEEVLRGGNFGQHDESHHHLQGAVGHNILRLQRDFRLLRYYPEEALAEPFFRLWHFVWRRRHA